MIVPMRKYAVVVHHDDYRAFLQELQEIGLAHLITIHEDDAPAASEHITRWQSYRNHFQFLEARGQVALPLDQCPLARELVRDLEASIELRFALEQALQNTRTQLTIHQQWQEIPLDRFKLLESHGLYAHFFQCPRKTFRQEWNELGLLEIYKESGDIVHFVLLTTRQEAPLLDAEYHHPPTTSVQEWQQRLGEQLAQWEENERNLDRLSARRNTLVQAMDSLADSVTWHQALHHTDKDQSGKLLITQCWVPTDKTSDMESLLQRSDVAWLRMDVAPGEDIPVLLKNNAFARLFQPIGKLFALPNAAEMDLTSFFAPFFALFFGLCLGDLGYGALLFIAATVLRFIPKAKEYRDVFVLIQWLSMATMVAGVVTGTLFGAPLGNFALFAPYASQFLGPNELFKLALWIGLIQIATGMILRVVNRTRQFGFIYGLSSIGWLLGLVGSVMLWNEWYAPVNLWITLGGVGLILFFSEPKGNIFKRVGLGIWELYGASGLVGDMLSYIRLFALGLSSSILGLVVNDIAMDVLGEGSFFGWIFSIIILLVGHGMNFFLATLSAFVHPMRLTFVEFYKNAGFNGGGKAYQPFTKKLKPTL